MLSPRARGALLLLVLLLHAGAVNGLTGVSFKRLEPPEPPALEVRLVAPEPPPPPPAPAPDIVIALLEDTPPPQWLPEPPPLELSVEPPPPDLPPPVFPVAKAEPRPTPPARPSTPAPPKPVQQTPPRPARPREIVVETLPPLPPLPPSTPADAPPSVRPPVPMAQASSAIKTVEAADVSYREPPQPIYPTYALRAREFGTALVGVLIDASGRPQDVSLEKSSTYGALDREALRCVRVAVFQPYLENGVARPVRVVIPIHFVLLKE